MTSAGPPWQIFGSESPEPETDEPEKAPERTAPAKIWPTGSARPGATPPVLAKAAPAGPVPTKARPPWELPDRAVPVTAVPPWPGPSAPGPSTDGLSVRLTALAGLIPIASARSGAGGFSQDLIDTAEELVSRADERLRLSASHTVVALAGGTGGGKSSLFNYLAGADFSGVGVTRPVTRDPHACVWGTADSGPLLEWLGVPRRYRYARG